MFYMEIICVWRAGFGSWLSANFSHKPILTAKKIEYRFFNILWRLTYRLNCVLSVLSGDMFDMTIWLRKASIYLCICSSTTDCGLLHNSAPRKSINEMLQQLVLISNTYYIYIVLVIYILYIFVHYVTKIELKPLKYEFKFEKFDSLTLKNCIRSAMDVTVA